MTMELRIYPTESQLGSTYYKHFKDMCMYYIVACDLFIQFDWFKRVVQECRRTATGVDGVLYVLMFVESFYLEVLMNDFELHRILREIVTILTN
jgi:hypothetical protein